MSASRQACAAWSVPPFRGRPQTAALARAFIRWIHREGFAAGTLLPRQPELCSILNSNNNTLGAALSTLSQHGVLRRSGRAGTRIVDPDAPVPGLWRVGIVINIDRGYYSRMHVEIHRVLAQRYCARASVFLRAAGAENVGMPCVSQIDGLYEAVTAGAIDGIISQTSIAGAGGKHSFGDIPVEIAGFPRIGASGVLLDQNAVVEALVRRLAKAGARRVAFVRYGADRPPPSRRLDARFLRAAGEAGLQASPDEIFAVPKDDNLYASGCAETAQRILSMPAERRPDGIAILNDNVAAYVSLAFLLAGYRPLLAVMDNLQIPLPFALPVLPSDVDIDGLAALAASKLMARVQNPSIPPSIDRVLPAEAPMRFPVGYPKQQKEPTP